MNAMSKTISSTLIIVGCLLSTRLVLAQAPQAALVQVAIAEQQLLAPTIDIAGTVVSRDSAQLSAEVAGRVIEVVEIGTELAVGDLVIRLDDPVIKAEKTQALSRIKREQARIEFYEREQQRLQTLKETNLAAQSQIDETELNLQVARADLVIAQAEARARSADVERLTIRAPFKGEMTARAVEVGERVAIGTIVARVMNPERLEVIAQLPIDSASFIRPSDSITITKNKMVDVGKIRAVVPFGDPQTHMAEARIDVDSSRWLIGQTVKVKVPIAEPVRMLAVPRDALVLRANGSSVYRVTSDNKAQQVKVTVDKGNDKFIGIRGGLENGDRVVIRGAERLRDGMTVAIQESKTLNGG
ncbi:MAG: efflux RND transporter periplasmic adaptor subunit [Gammaproteobacteria bacterium]|nr:efflux RND transporter periplasmic adaptor subunit [Gammaproteobacteria bacterium]